LAPSIFDPAGLMRESRRQNNLPSENDFEKGKENGNTDLLALLRKTVSAWEGTGK